MARRASTRIDDWGPLLRAARERKGLTQQDLALLTGVTRQTVAKVERDPRDSTIATVAQLARALDLEFALGPAGSPDPQRAAPDTALEAHLYAMVTAVERMQAAASPAARAET